MPKQMLVRIRLCGATHSLSLVRINPSLVVFRAAPWRTLLERMMMGTTTTTTSWPMPRVSFFDSKYSPASHVRAMIVSRLGRDDGRRKALLALVNELEDSFQRTMARAEAEERVIARAVARASTAPDSLALSGSPEETEPLGATVLDLALTSLESDTVWNAAHCALTTMLRPVSSSSDEDEDCEEEEEEDDDATTPVPTASLLIRQSDIVEF